MQRKPGFPVANCSIKMPDGAGGAEPADEEEQLQRRQQLINFGHAQWGFNNWSWSVTKQELDFVDFANGKFCAGVVTFVSVTVKTFDIHRENIGYATTLAANKGFAIYKARKCAVTNGLKETILSFGGSVATELMELLETHKTESSRAPLPPETLTENNQNIPNKLMEPKNVVTNFRKDSADSANSVPANNMRPMVPPVAVKNVPPAPLAPATVPPVAKALPMQASLPPPANRVPPPRHAPPLATPLAPQPRPNSNVSFVLQPVMPPLYPPPRPHMFPNYYEYSHGPWHFTYEPYDRHHGNVNLNFNLPPKNLVVNGRTGSVECKSPCARVEGEPLQYGPPQQGQGCWIKPTIFYDGFWTEQKVKKWVAEQVEKQFPEDPANKPASPSSSNGGHQDHPPSKS